MVTSQVSAYGDDPLHHRVPPFNHKSKWLRIEETSIEYDYYSIRYIRDSTLAWELAQSCE